MAHGARGPKPGAIAKGDRVPTLEFKGKPFVYAHHLSVPFRELVIDADKSLPGAEGPSLDDNLIIHGDNLEALKALLPKYAGKVDCIFIDPPYNTGKEGWAYNDNVNSPLMKEWLGKVVDGDDMERHDKWACMMWPRLALLRELLSEGGSLWMTLDDNEAFHAKLILGEVFGRGNVKADIVWRSSDNSNNDAKGFSTDKNHLFVASKSSWWLPNKLDSPEKRGHFRNPDNDPRGPWFDGNPVDSPSPRPNLTFDLTTPSGKTIKPPKNGWRWEKAEIETKLAIGEMRFNSDETRIIRRTYLNEMKGLPSSDLWIDLDRYGHNRAAKYELQSIFGGVSPFETPKPTKLINAVLEVGTHDDALILDSFAGSGTTAHAVLSANAKDGGNRKFILIETEDYADTLTAERVRRVAKGYLFKGSQKTELLREKLTWTKLNNADALLAKVASFDNLHTDRFDRIDKTVKDGELIVTGIVDCDETASGLGGSFTYCELGEPMDMARFFDGANPPAFDQVARYVAYTATGATLDAVASGKDHFIGEAGGYRLHLVYKPDTAFMRSDAATQRCSTWRPLRQLQRLTRKVESPS